MMSTQEAETNSATAMQRLEAKVTKPESLRAVDVAEAYLEDEGYRRDGLLTLRYWKGDWWRWDGPRYVELPVKDLKARTMAFLGKNEITRSKAYTKFASDVIANLEGECFLDSTVTQPSWLNESEAVYAPNCISMQNGILDLAGLLAGDTGCLKQHSPEFFSCVSLPYAFNPEATCSGWEKYLQEVQPDIEAQDFLQEWCGYCLTHDTSLHKFVLLEGDSRHGKSVFCKVLRGLLGNENVSAVPLESFGEKFSLSHTIGKLANIAEEIGPLDKVAEGHLKAFVGGSVMAVERKYRDPISVEPTARLLLATNTRPRFADRSNGVWERMILVPFPIEIPLEKRDPHLDEKLYKELPGIFNWAVGGLFRLRKRGHFVEPKVCIDAKEDYKLESNQTRAFIIDTFEVCEGAEFEKGEAYQLYADHCRRSGYTPMGECQFGKEVARWYREVTGREMAEPVRRRVGTQRPRYYQGIRVFRGEEEGGPYGPYEPVSFLHSAIGK